MRVVGIAGSLRHGSYNWMLLRAAVDLAPAQMHIEPFDLADGGPVGTARGQQVLKLTLMSTLALIMPHPGVVVGQMKDKFADGRLVHEPTREFLAAFLRDFAEWMERMGVPSLK